MRQKIFDGKPWYSPSPSFIHKLFRYPKLMKHQRIPLRKFSALWDKKISAENPDTPPPPLLSINTFTNGNILKRSTGLLYDMFRYCETKQLRLKNVNQPPLLSLTFFDTRIWWNSKGFPYEIFRHWDKILSTQNGDTPPPVLSINFFATGNFLKHSTEGFPYHILRHCETKNLRRKTLDTPLPPLFHKLFRYRKFSETHHRRLPQRNFSGTVRQKIFDGKPWYSPPPPPSFPYIFAPWIYLKHCTEGFLYEMFRYCETKNVRRKIVA